MQETYLRAYRTFDNFARGSNAKAWLFTILYSVFVNRYRKESRTPQSVSVDEVEERFLAVQSERDWIVPPDLEPPGGPEVEQALAELPEAFRSAVLLVDVEGLSYEDASAALACPVGTLRSRLARARKLLFLSLYDYARKSGLVRGS